MTKEEAIRWMEEEKSSFEHAPALNGCQMTKEWHNAIDVYSMAIAALRQQEQESNDPLTLDELRQMVGEPVWLIGVGDKDEWVRIDSINSLTIGFSRFGDAETWCFRSKSYGVCVLAYRQKP